jgi:hypothetical protein
MLTRVREWSKMDTKGRKVDKSGDKIPTEWTTTLATQFFSACRQADLQCLSENIIIISTKKGGLLYR